jgi:hypothetical protein
MNKDIVLFTDDNQEIITLERLFKKIYKNNETKAANIMATAEQVGRVLTTVQDVVTVMPLLIQLQQTAIQNDEHLLKLAMIVQRMQQKKPGKFNDDAGLTEGLSDDQKQELLRGIREQMQPGQASDF